MGTSANAEMRALWETKQEEIERLKDDLARQAAWRAKLENELAGEIEAAMYHQEVAENATTDLETAEADLDAVERQLSACQAELAAVLEERDRYKAALDRIQVALAGHLPGHALWLILAALAATEPAGEATAITPESEHVRNPDFNWYNEGDTAYRTSAKFVQDTAKRKTQPAPPPPTGEAT